MFISQSASHCPRISHTAFCGRLQQNATSRAQRNDGLFRYVHFGSGALNSVTCNEFILLCALDICYVLAGLKPKWPFVDFRFGWFKTQSDWPFVDFRFGWFKTQPDWPFVDFRFMLLRVLYTEYVLNDIYNMTH